MYRLGTAQAVFLNARARAKKKLSIVLAVLVALILAPHAWATTYTLSGGAYNLASRFGVYVTATGVTGSFTTASPLPGNLDKAPIAGGTGGLGHVTGWSFDDGVFTYTDANSAIWQDAGGNFAVSTDAGGAITGFFIVLTMPGSGAVAGQPAEFLFLGFDGPGTVGAVRANCFTLLAPGGSCTGYRGFDVTDSVSSLVPGTATFSSSAPCQLNTKGKCRPTHTKHPK